MAVRIAYALGLHRQETLEIFPRTEQVARSKIWQSLFIMDRFIAATMGRPVAIAEEECSGDVFDPCRNDYQHSRKISSGQLCTAGMEAAVRSCHVVGLILRKVYLQRKISLRVAQELANECKKWPESLSPALHWKQASPDNPRQAIAILHSTLVYCHSVILLSRPFLLYVLSAEVQRNRFGNQPQHRSWKRMNEFLDACKISSMHAIAVVQQAYEGRYLPRRNTFVANSLFAAALVILAHEFVRPSSDELTHQCIANSITIMSYHGVADPQAKRAAHVLMEFRNAIREQAKQNALRLQQETTALQQPLPAFAPDTDIQKFNLSPSHGDFAPIPPLFGATTASTSDAAAASSDSFDQSTLRVPQMSKENSFSGFLDLTNTVLPDFTDLDASLGDEAIDFDALLGAWPTPPYDTVADAPTSYQNATQGTDDGIGTSYNGPG